MKFAFLQAESVLDGIALVAPDLGIEVVSAKEAELTVTIEAGKKDTLTVTREGNAATIAFGEKACFFRALATLCAWVREGAFHHQRCDG